MNSERGVKVHRDHSRGGLLKLVNPMGPTQLKMKKVHQKLESWCRLGISQTEKKNWWPSFYWKFTGKN